MKKPLLVCAVLGALTLSLACLSTVFAPKLSRLEALPPQTSRRVFLRTGTSGWSNGAYMYSWGSETKTTQMTHVFDFGSNDGLYYVDITLSKVDGFLFLDGSAVDGSAPNWDTTNANPWLKSADAPALAQWGKSDVYVLSGVWENNPSVSGGNKLSLSANQLAELLKRYTSCSSDARSYADSCLAYPQLQADFGIDSFSGNLTSVPKFASGEKNGTTLGEKVVTMKYQYQHYDDAPPEEEEPVALEKREMRQTYSDFIFNNAYPIDAAPTIGSCNLLVIPVWFTDSSNYFPASYKSNVRADIEAAYFGSREQTGWHSVKTYYETESLGQLSVAGTVSSWYEPGVSSAQAGAYTVAQTRSIVTSATNWYFANNPGKSRTDFDRDHNGYLDGVLLIYAAPNYDDLGNKAYSNLWAYCQWIQNTSLYSLTSPGPNAFFWASFDFMYGNRRVSARTGQTQYKYGDDSHCDLDAHTYIHEMGHVFGLEDYYDYGSNPYTPAGCFSMQDYNVGGHDPFSVMAFGWANPYIPTESCEITIGAFESTHDLILLTPSWNAYDSVFDEYLLLELFTPTGLNALDSTYQYKGYYPKGPSAVGIRLWHVDARLLYINKDAVFTASQMTSDAGHHADYGVVLAFSNSSDSAHATELGSEYYDYNLLQLIRNNPSATYHPTDYLTASSLFRDGDAFDVSTYRGQFKGSTKLDNGSSLGWSFTVSIVPDGASSTATVNLIRA